MFSDVVDQLLLRAAVIPDAGFPGEVSNLKEEPLEKNLGSFFGTSTAEQRKKAWCSTHFFQKLLHSFRVSKENSMVSL